MHFRPFVWLKNTVRNRFRGSMLGGVVRRPEPRRLWVVSATRMNERAFWKESALGRSLKTWRADPRIVIDVAFENRAGLPAVYNRALSRAAANDALLFLHDDIWLDDSQWLPKLFVALKRYDVVGVAGNTRRVKDQVAWLFTKEQEGGFSLDRAHLSGAVAHGSQPRGEVSDFGPAPVRCELIDGLFMAVRNDVVSRSRVAFDERFDFHFYDLDFCRTARQAGLSIGTWPIEMTHQSRGAFGSPGWRAGLERYRGKWKH